MEIDSSSFGQLPIVTTLSIRGRINLGFTSRSSISRTNPLRSSSHLKTLSTKYHFHQYTLILISLIQHKLCKEGMRPVYRSTTTPEWQRTPEPFKWVFLILFIILTLYRERMSSRSLRSRSHSSFPKTARNTGSLSAILGVMRRICSSWRNCSQNTRRVTRMRYTFTNKCWCWLKKSGTCMLWLCPPQRQCWIRRSLSLISSCFPRKVNQEHSSRRYWLFGVFTWFK